MTEPERIMVPLGDGTFLVESNSDPGDFHKVDPEIPFCPCEAFFYKKGCSHLREVAKWGGSQAS